MLPDYEIDPESDEQDHRVDGAANVSIDWSSLAAHSEQPAEMWITIGEIRHLPHLELTTPLNGDVTWFNLSKMLITGEMLQNVSLKKAGQSV